MTAQQKIIVVIEKTDTGFSAYAKDHPVFTTGISMNELLNNAVEAVALYFEDTEIEIPSIIYEIDFKQFFQYYKVINSKALAGKIGMNPTLLSQYVRGQKKPSEKQGRKILEGINKIGQELAEMNIIYERRERE